MIIGTSLVSNYKQNECVVLVCDHEHMDMV